jgi:hypothetical protein
MAYITKSQYRKRIFGDQVIYYSAKLSKEITKAFCRPDDALTGIGD